MSSFADGDNAILAYRVLVKRREVPAKSLAHSRPSANGKCCVSFKVNIVSLIFLNMCCPELSEGEKEKGRKEGGERERWREIQRQRQRLGDRNVEEWYRNRGKKGVS